LCRKREAAVLCQRARIAAAPVLLLLVLDNNKCTALYLCACKQTPAHLSHGLLSGA